MTDPSWLTVEVRDRWRVIQARHGLVSDGLPGAQTVAAIEELESQLDTSPGLEPGEVPPRWLREALRFIGVRELPGDRHNPTILAWLATCTLGHWGRSRDETPWCSAYVNAMIESAFLEGTKSAMARSWLGWGVECPPRVGAVVVFPRGAPPSGHVGFVERVRGPLIDVLGGNQNNEVSIVERRANEALGFRWPAEGEST